MSGDSVGSAWAGGAAGIGRAASASPADREPLHSADRARSDRIAATWRCICRRDGLSAPVQ